MVAANRALIVSQAMWYVSPPGMAVSKGWARFKWTDTAPGTRISFGRTLNAFAPAALGCAMNFVSRGQVCLRGLDSAPASLGTAWQGVLQRECHMALAKCHWHCWIQACQHAVEASLLPKKATMHCSDLSSWRQLPHVDQGQSLFW